MEARQRALTAALDAMMEWLESGAGQVAIFDATNSTVSRRQFLVSSQFPGVPLAILCGFRASAPVIFM